MALNHDIKKIIISYRGTANLVNWIHNFNFIGVKVNIKDDSSFKGAKVHNGFLRMSNSLYEQTQTELLKLIKKHPQYNIVITGHSLGGAIATINAFNLVQNKILTWEQIELYTFGQPRVGNKKFAKYMFSRKIKLMRVTNNNDLVPAQPRRFLGYRHHQSEVYINDKLITKLCKHDDFDEDFSCSLSHGIKRTVEAHFHYWDLMIISDC